MRIALLIMLLCAASLHAGDTSGFILTAHCSSTETERDAHMIVVGQAVTIIVHDEVLWTQASRLIDQECELGLLLGRPNAP